ncbi:MAG TPA: serine--tRNA ligase [Mycobacteriales bacterium]|nr:serine--tRNA ligase [Mycobacteriales bacterium]
MIDIKALRDDPERFRVSQRVRGEDPQLVDALLAADEAWRAATTRYEGVRAEQKALGRQVAAAPAELKATLLEKAKSLADEVKSAEAAVSADQAELRAASYRVSNLVEGAPAGGEDDFVVLDTVGAVPAYDFAVRDHVELGELLGAIDIARGAKVSGARFYFLTGVGALLELALVNLAIAQAVAAGFTPVIPPALVKPEAMEGTGFLGAHAAEVYRLADDDLYLVGTSEVPLAAFHMDEILDADRLPMRYVGFSPCFRREAGSYGRDTQGIIRVHWFDKVEMFSFCDPADAEVEHQRLLGWEREFLGKLELPYRVVDIAAGDLGSSAVRKFDCEAWVPSQGRYRELTSTSNCTSFQARRLGVRTRAGDATIPVATLNGTLVAVARAIVALLEVHQRADGSVRVPAALAPYLGREVLEPVR